jgi:catechol 2,3-dioxygenase-like lactoylglutathione lyase family enzyme
MLAVEHVGMTVKDLDTSVRFYSALFDTAPLDRAEWRGKDAEYVANMLGQPGLTMDAAFFQLPGGNTILEICQFHNIKDGIGTPVRHYQSGGTHLGFYVDNIDAVTERLEKAGTKLLSKPVSIEFGPYKGTGGRSVLFRDPDGVNLQLMEISGRPGRLPLPGQVAAR